MSAFDLKEPGLTGHMNIFVLVPMTCQTLLWIGMESTYFQWRDMPIQYNSLTFYKDSCMYFQNIFFSVWISYWPKMPAKLKEEQRALNFTLQFVQTKEIMWSTRCIFHYQKYNFFFWFLLKETIKVKSWNGEMQWKGNKSESRKSRKWTTGRQVLNITPDLFVMSVRLMASLVGSICGQCRTWQEM